MLEESSIGVNLKKGFMDPDPPWLSNSSRKTVPDPTLNIYLTILFIHIKDFKDLLMVFQTNDSFERELILLQKIIP
jgi:hypothetical protein